jgi:hypothetical protein
METNFHRFEVAPDSGTVHPGPGKNTANPWRFTGLDIATSNVSPLLCPFHGVGGLEAGDPLSFRQG